MLSVLIASPGDTQEERAAIEGAIRSWNSDNSPTRKVVLLPLRWELDATARVGAGDGQLQINKQLAERSDIVIAVFRSRLGKPTGREASGTAEEIRHGVSSGKPTHVFFADMPHPSNVDDEQLKALREYKESLLGQGLVLDYVSFDDLSARVRSALEADVRELLVAGSPESANAGRAVLRVQNSRTGKGGQQHLIVENIGDVAADNVRLDIEAASGGRPPEVLEPLEAKRITAHNRIEFLLLTVDQVAPTWKVSYRWEDSSGEHEDFQSLNAF
ncbi:DUF4062 domain-containing protein [Streptomyces zaomyceticus]|uniref:DUF4062 domain-containing protein n=1 Tax=Streptomyces zaomyceticus TaxID=68286 RepID=A0ABZ1LHV5_9ACTN